VARCIALFPNTRRKRNALHCIALHMIVAGGLRLHGAWTRCHKKALSEAETKTAKAPKTIVSKSVQEPNPIWVDFAGGKIGVLKKFIRTAALFLCFTTPVVPFSLAFENPARCCAFVAVAVTSAHSVRPAATFIWIPLLHTAAPKNTNWNAL
jgi:hypothetical protein